MSTGSNSTAIDRFLQTWHVVRARLSRKRIVGASFQVVPVSIATIGAVAVLAVTLAALMDHWDAAIVRWFREMPASVYWFFRSITDLGKSDWILVGSGVCAIALASSQWWVFPRAQKIKLANWHGDLCFVFASVAIMGTLASLTKNTIGRARPRHLETLGPLEFDFGAFTSGFASFPSGHSTTFGALAMAVALLMPRLSIPLLLFAIVGGISRVAVGAHYPSDIIAGLLFGSLGTVLIARWLAARNVLFKPGPTFFPMRRRPPFSRLS